MDQPRKLQVTMAPRAPGFTDASAGRGLAAMCLVGIALIHLLDVKDKIHEVPYIGWLFIGLVVASMVLADALVRRDDPIVWVAAGLTAASTIVGYVVSRSVGLPGEGGADIGNWWEGLGAASLLVEAMLLWLVARRLTGSAESSG